MISVELFWHAAPFIPGAHESTGQGVEYWRRLMVVATFVAQTHKVSI